MKIENKKEIVKQLKEDFTKAQSVVFVDFTGLRARDLNLLRTKIRKVDGKLQVAKNTLIGRALDQIEKWPGGKFEGSTAIVLAFSEPLSPIKALVEFRKDSEKPEIKGGFFEGNWTNTEEVFQLSQIPQREELLAQVIAYLNTPVQRFITAASNPMRKLVTIVDALSNRKKGGV